MLLLSSQVFAEKTINGKDLSLDGKINVDNIKKSEAKETPPPVNKESKFSTSCKDSLGKEIKYGELGYDTCLTNLKMKHDLNKLNKNQNNTQDPSGASVNFKIGN